MYGHRDAQRRVHCFEFCANKAHRNVIKAGAAILFGNAHAEQIQLGHLAENLAMGLLLFVPFLDVRRNFFLRKLAHGLHQRLVVVIKLKFDHRPKDYTDLLSLESAHGGAIRPLGKSCFQDTAPHAIRNEGGCAKSASSAALNSKNYSAISHSSEKS